MVFLHGYRNKSVKTNLKTTFLFLVTVSLIVCVFILCEYIVFNVVLYQCGWPPLDPKTEDANIKNTNEAPLRVMFFTDTHLVGSIKGYWIEKIRTQWEMGTVFKFALKLHRPDVVFVLGDLTDEGQYSSEDDFNDFVKRFYNTFPISAPTEMYVLVGNHDVGFHYEIGRNRIERFEKKFNSPSAQLITIRSNHFVLVNSIGLEGDGCFLCTDTERNLKKIENTLNCSKNEDLMCKDETRLENYSKPILLQHFPLYRESDVNCSEPDDAPYLEKIKILKEAYDCLSKSATEKILKQINPRVVINGHTHHGCTRALPTGDGVEITLPSFNWIHKNNPSFGLGIFTSNNYAFSKCYMPQQSTAIVRYVIGVCCIVFAMFYWYRRSRRYGK